MRGFKTLVGGELKGYTELLCEVRAIATERVAGAAKKLAETVRKVCVTFA